MRDCASSKTSYQRTPADALSKTLMAFELRAQLSSIVSASQRLAKTNRLTRPGNIGMSQIAHANSATPNAIRADGHLHTAITSSDAIRRNSSVSRRVLYSSELLGVVMNKVFSVTEDAESNDTFLFATYMWIDNTVYRNSAGGFSKFDRNGESQRISSCGAGIL